MLFMLLVSFVMLSCSMQRSITSVSTFDELEYPYPVKKVEVQEDMHMAYMEAGRGRPIILVHGLGSYAPAWKKNFEALSKNNRVIAVDLPGFGKSSKGNYAYDMSFFAESLKLFMEKMNLASATLAGHSMGGQISILTALAHPDMVEKLILIAPAGFETFTPGQQDWFKDVMTTKGIMLTPVESIVNNIGYNFYKFNEDAQFMIDDRIAMRDATEFRAYAHANKMSVHGMVDEPVYNYLSQLTCPTLILFGKYDNLIPNRFLNPGKTQAVAEKGANQIENSELHMIPNAGHFVHFEQSEIVNDIIREFLSR